MSISRRRFLGLSSLALIGIGISACTSTKDSTSSDSTNGAAAPASPTDAKSHRVVALGPGQAENLLSIGILPVGMALPHKATTIPSHITSSFGDRFDLDSITPVGDPAKPDVDLIRALNPTVIYATDDLDPTIIDALGAFAAVVTTDPSPAQWRDSLLTQAEAIGRRTEAKKQLNLYDAEATKLANKHSTQASSTENTSTTEDTSNTAQTDTTPTAPNQTEATPAASSPATSSPAASSPATPTSTPVTVLYSDAQGLGFAGADSMAGVIARDCGFSLAQPPAPVAPESPLPSITTDWLYYAVADGAANPTTDPAWAALPAVEKNQAIEVDYSLWFEAPSILAATKILNTYTQGPGK